MILRRILLALFRPFWDAYATRMHELIAIRLKEHQTRIDESIDVRLKEYETRMDKSIDVKISDVSDRIEINHIVSEKALTPRDPGHRWKRLQIGITDLCNLLCAHCTRLPNSPLDGTLPLKKFMYYLSRFSPDWFEQLIISDWGEPTIVKSLLDYLYFAKLSGWNNVHFITNATNPNEHLFEEIISQKLLAELFMSVEAVSPELYEFIRKTPFDKFRTFVKMVSFLRKRYNSPTTLIFNVVCMKANLHELPGIVHMAGEYGIHLVQMVHLHTTGWGNKEEGKLCVPEQHLDSMDRSQVLKTFEKVFSIAEHYKIIVNPPEFYPEISTRPSNIAYDDSKTYADGEIVDKGDDYKCQYPLTWVQVGFWGDIFPCCQMGKNWPMGNINKLDFASIWNNLRYKRLLDGLRPDGEPVEICARCNVLAGKRF